MVETRKNEIRYVTSDPSKMLNKYLAKRVIKTWEESFIDEDTGDPSDRILGVYDLILIPE